MLDDEDITIRVYNPWINADQGEDYVEQTIENKKKDNDDWFDRLTAQYKKNSYFVVYTKGAEADADVLDTDDVTTVSGKVTTKKTTGLTRRLQRQLHHGRHQVHPGFRLQRGCY